MLDQDDIANLRQYAPSVSVVRSASRGARSAEGATTFDDIEEWLLGPAVLENDLLAVIEALAWRLVACGVELDRLTVHVGTLHPQLIGFMWAWYRFDGICEEARIGRTTLQTESYLRSPLTHVIEGGRVVRENPQDPESAKRFPLMADLKPLGITDYIALPFATAGLVHTAQPSAAGVFPVARGETATGATRFHNAATIATSREGGFFDHELTQIKRVLKLVALHLERHIAVRIASNLVDTYIGPVAGVEVLHGTIQRGDGHAINAIIWASDLRDFTGLTDRLPAQDVTAVLNAAFERFAGAVADHCGEVLKFIGDGLLAVFRYEEDADKAIAAQAALLAARQALRDLDDLNRNPPSDLGNVVGWCPLAAGIALHDGEVFFGNVGAPDRLDFTVIGRAVNEASRVEGLTKELGHALLITEGVARVLPDSLVDLGVQNLRGVDRPVRIFGA